MLGITPNASGRLAGLRRTATYTASFGAISLRIPTTDPAFGWTRATARPAAVRTSCSAPTPCTAEFSSKYLRCRVWWITISVSYTHLRAHETRHDLVCRLLLEKKKK